MCCVAFAGWLASWLVVECDVMRYTMKNIFYIYFNSTFYLGDHFSGAKLTTNDDDVVMCRLLRKETKEETTTYLYASIHTISLVDIHILSVVYKCVLEKMCVSDCCFGKPSKRKTGWPATRDSMWCYLIFTFTCPGMAGCSSFFSSVVLFLITDHENLEIIRIFLNHRNSQID